MSTRVRYAPSPTGFQHIGGVRTILYNYFFARATGGKFILRIEDTDQARSTPESLQDLYDTLEWLGLEWDEGPDGKGEHGPYIQSQRLSLYQEYARKLIDDGKAYYCFCTAEDLDALREEQKKEKKDFGYNRKCRDIDPAEAMKRVDAGEAHVVRLQIPLQGKTEFHDEILGDISRRNIDVNPDPVILKSDGFPTYHLAVVIDDHLMEITHIMRGQEWIPSTPLHVLMYDAFGWVPPKYCHLPMVMGKDGKKLSKRHGDTALRDFRKAGYLPETIINYITLIGWSFDDSREFFTREELEELFTLDRLNKAPGVFDYRKLDWFNGQYIRRMTAAAFRSATLPLMQDAGIVSNPPSEEEEAVLAGLMPLVQERLKLLPDIVEMSRFLFQDVRLEDPAVLIPKKMDAAGTLKILDGLREIMSGFDVVSDEAMETLFRDKAEALGVKLGALLMPLRIAVTGSSVSPPLIEAMRLLGSEKTLQRLDAAHVLLSSAV